MSCTIPCPILLRGLGWISGSEGLLQDTPRPGVLALGFDECTEGRGMNCHPLLLPIPSKRPRSTAGISSQTPTRTLRQRLSLRPRSQRSGRDQGSVRPRTVRYRNFFIHPASKPCAQKVQSLSSRRRTGSERIRARLPDARRIPRECGESGVAQHSFE